MKGNKIMINFETLARLTNDEGITLKNGNEIRYKTGYQVATEGLETVSVTEAYEVVKKWKNCGVWLSEGIYYIDRCKRISVKKEAIHLGITHNQLSIYDWKRETLIWLNERR